MADEKNPDAGHILALRVLKILEEAGFEARLAGGCVRDRLLGIRPKDYDVATKALPDEICTVFKQKSIRVVPTGIDHGTITVVIAGQGIEVTSLRHDVSTDGRRATVAFGSTFEEDAARRDFTINALFEDAEGRIYDFFGGQDDLKKGILRFVGGAADRIREDYLRILRLFRFWARFGFAPDRTALDACQTEGQGLRIVSQERITSELMGTLEGDFVTPPLEAMGTTGILQQILDIKALPPSLLPVLDALKIGRKTERSPARLALILRLKFGSDAKKIDEAMQNLRLSRQIQQKVLLHILPPLESLNPSDPATALDHIDLWESTSAPFLEDLLPLWRIMHPDQKMTLDALERIESTHGHRRRGKVPVDGQMLITKSGLKPGPELGVILQELKHSWRLGEWQTPEEGLKRVQQMLSKKQ